MSLINVKEYLFTELTELKKEQQLLEEEILVNKTKMEEILFFIKTLEKEQEDREVFSLYNNKSSNICTEKKDYEEEHKKSLLLQKRRTMLVEKKEKLESMLLSLDTYMDSDTVNVSREKIDSLKKMNKQSRDDLKEATTNFKKVLDSFLFLDPNRVKVEYSELLNRLDKVDNNLSQCHKGLSSLK